MIEENTPKILKTDHIFIMTDDTGMFQHSTYGVPNRSMGYTADDNARALIMAVKLYSRHRGKKISKLITNYLSFLCLAQNPDGTFQNFMTYTREFSQEKASEDCFGRCMWALCYTFSDPMVSQNVKRTAWVLIKNALPNCLKLNSPRAKAYTIIGLRYLDEKISGTIISKLADTLTDHYAHYKDGDWHWFEDSLTCCNAALPWAMLAAYSVTKRRQFAHVGFESLRFLDSKVFRDGYFKPIGCNGWLHKGGEPAEFDEQPIEACETMYAFLEAYAASGKKYYLDRAKTCYSWYRGKNFKNLSLIDSETGGCYDGITAEGLNFNQGGESVVSFWLAYLELSSLEKKPDPTPTKK